MLSHVSVDILLFFVHIMCEAYVQTCDRSLLDSLNPLPLKTHKGIALKVTLSKDIFRGCGAQGTPRVGIPAVQPMD